MDGFKKGLKRRLNESVQLKLSFTLSLAIFVVAVVAGVFSFMSAFDEAHELQDDVLRQVAQLMDSQHLSPAAPTADTRPKDADEESRVIVQRLGEASSSAAGVDAGGTLSLPTTLADGLHTLEVSGQAFRVLVKTTAAGERIAVAQEAGFRNEIARDGALRTVMPFLVLMPMLLLIVADLVRKMFRPIAALSKEIDLRAEQELHPIEDRRLPIEVRPFAVAINRLLARVGQSMESQRRFVADAAHELRSPLTALSLQAERLAETEMPGQARERLTVLRQGIARSRSLLDQLLTLARAQSASDLPKSSVSIQSIYRRVLEDSMPLAEAKQIDIGVEGTQDAEVWASELDMITVVKNLVDNAIRYTPEGGRVDLSVVVSNGKAELRIQDNGPGIPLAERNRVFDPFYRTLGSEQMGSGLGLSIVQTIASRMGAEIQLDFTDDANQRGAKVTVFIPLKVRQAPRHPQAEPYTHAPMSAPLSLPSALPADALGACRALGVDSENAPQRGQFWPDSPPHSGTMGQEDGKKWAAAAHSQPTIPKSDRHLVLGIETSCDETGVALVRCEPSGGVPALLAHALHSQIAMHQAYGGVVPELASRDHIRRVLPLAEEVLAQAGARLADVDVVAYTRGPGLAGALLVGAGVACALAAALGRPVLGVHHLEGHLLSPFLSADPPEFPFVALLVSGGHTQLMRVDGVGRYALLGETIDDAAGEAFDKSAKLLGLGYPGGPALSLLAQQGDAKAFALPRPLLHSGNLDFSFAGLKTAVLTQAKKLGDALEARKADLAASTEAAIVDVLVHKTLAALHATGLTRVVVAGGVGANRHLRAQLDAACATRRVRVHYPELHLCTDNGAMIALAAAMRLQAGRQQAHCDYAFDVKPRWPLDALEAENP